MHRLKGLLFLGFILFCYPPFAFTQDITILYTGESHASLYPCHCPSSSDGGMLRRATKIKEIRRENPNLLLVDSGGFFAGGALDSRSLNTELDKLRTQITLKAMDIMGYDAAAVGDDEFNFGTDFLLSEVSKTKLPFLSSNIKSEDFLPFIIKNVAGIKFGILAFTSEEVGAKSGLEILKPQEILAATVAEVRGKGADIIVVLSHLGEDADLRLAEEALGIDILITGHKIIRREENYTKVGSSLLIRPHWEARALGRCDLKIEDKKIVDFKIEKIRLSLEIKDDPDMKKIVPECFSDNDCWQPKLKGKCLSPASTKAHCEFSLPTKIDLTVILPKQTKFPYDAKHGIEIIKNFLPGVEATYIEYPGKKAGALIKKLKIKMLPAYIFPKKIEEEPAFSNIKVILDKQDDFYIAKPSVIGVALFTGRKRIENRLDVFLTLKEKNIAELLEVLKELTEKDKSQVDLYIHFAAISTNDGFKALAGDELIEEYLRQVSIMHHYPLRWWDYAICRVKDITSTRWDDCLKNMDLELIKSEARLKTGSRILKENIKLTEELEISSGPTFLFENQEVFSTQATPTVEDLEKVILE